MSLAMELAKNGTPVPGREDIVKISENQYVITSIPNNNVIINTSKAVKSKKENEPIFRFLRQTMLEYFVKKELREQGIDTTNFVLTPEIIEKATFVEPEEYIAMCEERERRKKMQSTESKV